MVGLLTSDEPQPNGKAESNLQKDDARDFYREPTLKEKSYWAWIA